MVSKGVVMNELNYASLEASQRLVANGIVLETDLYWYKDYDGEWKPSNDLDEFVRDRDYIPAPSIAEVTREFTKRYSVQEFAELVRRFYEPRNEKGVIFYMYLTLTDIDKAIDLLIWTVEQKKEK
jgi:hypothetical protein